VFRLLVYSKISPSFLDGTDFVLDSFVIFWHPLYHLFGCMDLDGIKWSCGAKTLENFLSIYTR
jgi:hypothetical protein